MDKKKVGVIGDGGWGTTLAILLYNKGLDVALWSAFKDYKIVLNHKRENIKFLPGVQIPEEMTITDKAADLTGMDYYILAVPCQYMRTVLEMFLLENVVDVRRPVISCIKGIENGTLAKPSEIIREILGKVQVAVLSGPTIAFEVARGIPTTCVISSQDKILARHLQVFFSTPLFRVYTSDDVTGVELGGALKNIIAIAAGLSDGMGFGVNTKSALLTRGLVEISRLGVKMGAKAETFHGLSGIGDLATTCMSEHSRNRWFGEEIGKGKKTQEILKATDAVVEGVATAKSAHELAKKHEVDMPITTEIYRVIYENKSPRDAVRDLMTRAPKEEVEEKKEAEEGAKKQRNVR